jgi:hypothetical protein
MTRDELVDKIRSRGHWRVHFRPLAPGDELAGPMKCFGIVQRASVSLRGWDYPHVPSRDEDISILNDSAESRTDWGQHIEYWRMFETSQFIHLRALHEDWRNEDPFASGLIHDPGTVLGIGTNTWLIAEIFEFLARLAADGLYEQGVEVTLGLHGAQGRELWVDSPDRAPLAYSRRSDENVVTYRRKLSSAEIVEQKVRAAEAVRHIFERFRFVISNKNVLEMIEELYSLGIGRG